MKNSKKLILVGFLLLCHSKYVFAQNSLIINEIHPNPKGKDAGREWLELYNDSNQTIFLDDYQVKSSQESKNLKNSAIEAKDFKIIKIKLKNSDEKISLSHKGKTINEASYSKAPEALSLSLNEKNEYTWTSASKKLPNPRERTLNGKVKALNKNLILFESNGQQLEINSDQSLNPQLLKLIDKSQSTTTEVEESFNSLDAPSTPSYILKGITIKNQRPKNSETPKEFLLELLSLCSILTLLLAKLSLPYKSKKQRNHASLKLLPQNSQRRQANQAH